MNLTKLFVAGLCFTALTASAAYVKTNAFETGEDQTGWFVGTNDTISTRSVTNDSINGRSDYAGATPLTGTANERVLKLDTEGAVWTNTISGGISFDPTPVYVDMLVKFVPSEDLPTVDAAGKFALAIKPNAGGTNMLNVANNKGSTFNWEETAQEISTSEWYRVTVRLSWDGDLEASFAQVYVAGVAVGSPLQNNGNTTLNSIGFQGTGYIDEVVVRSDNPFGAVVELTLSFGTGIASVYVGETQKFHNDTVSAPATLVITAAQWKEIASVTGPSTVTWDSGAVGSSVATVTVDNASATTVLISSRVETSADPIGGTTLYADHPATNVAAWASANSLTSLDENFYNNFLLNVSTNSLPDLDITSIAVSNTTVTVTVAATGVDFQNINGTLKLITSATLGGTEAVTNATVIGYSPVTISQDIGTNKFVKALVE